MPWQHYVALRIDSSDLYVPCIVDRSLLKCDQAPSEAFADYLLPSVRNQFDRYRNGICRYV